MIHSVKNVTTYAAGTFLVGLGVMCGLLIAAFLLLSMFQG
jgi:hypothetical protein